MRYVGVDLHKQSISLCVVELENRARKVIERRRFHCDQEFQMEEYLVWENTSWSSKRRPATSGSSDSSNQLPIGWYWLTLHICE